MAREEGAEMWLDDPCTTDPDESSNRHVQSVTGLVSTAESQALINRLLIFLLFSSGKQPSPVDAEPREITFLTAVSAAK